MGCRQQPPPLPGPFRRRCDPRSGPAVPAAAAKGPGRGEPAPPSRSSARLPPCEIRRPPRRAPGPPCRSGEDAAGEAPHLAGLLGAGDGVPSLCRVKEAIFLAEIYVIYVFPPLPAPFRQCLALLGALASTRSVQAEPQHLGENRTLRLGYSGVFLGVDFLKIIFILVFLRGFGVGFFFFFWRNFSRIRTKWLLVIAQSTSEQPGEESAGAARAPELRRPQRAAPGGTPRPASPGPPAGDVGTVGTVLPLHAPRRENNRRLRAARRDGEGRRRRGGSGHGAAPPAGPCAPADLPRPPADGTAPAARSFLG